MLLLLVLLRMQMGVLLLRMMMMSAMLLLERMRRMREGRVHSLLLLMKVILLLLLLKLLVLVLVLVLHLHLHLRVHLPHLVLPPHLLYPSLHLHLLPHPPLLALVLLLSHRGLEVPPDIRRRALDGGHQLLLLMLALLRWNLPHIAVKPSHPVLLIHPRELLLLLSALLRMTGMLRQGVIPVHVRRLRIPPHHHPWVGMRNAHHAHSTSS
jgi:hypothetical protein